MATTYTTNYHLGKQTDHSDKFLMSVITDNMDAIDTAMKANADAAEAVTPEVQTSTIDSTALAALFSGTVTGLLSEAVSGTVNDVYGLVRAYMLTSTDAMQILEAVDGTRRTRYYTNSAWGAWVDSSGGSSTHVLEDEPPLTFPSDGTPITQWLIRGNTGGVGDAVSSANMFNSPLQNQFYDPSTGQPTSTPNAVSSVDLIPVSGETYYTAAPHFVTSQPLAGCFILEYDSSQAFLKNTSAQGTCTVYTRSDTRYVRIQYGLSSGTYSTDTIDDFMLNVGQSAETYEPHAEGYEIPITVTSGGSSDTVTINVDAPLGAGDTLSNEDYPLSIPTYSGSCTLSVGTTVQPESVKIAYT